MSVQTRTLAASLAIAAGLLTVHTTIASAQSQPQAANGGWAVIRSDGTLGRNSNVAKVEHVSTGVYMVTFSQDISDCAMTATLGGKGKNSTLPGYIVVGKHGKGTARVGTFLGVTLLPADFNFNLVATC